LQLLCTPRTQCLLQCRLLVLLLLMASCRRPNRHMPSCLLHPLLAWIMSLMLVPWGLHVAVLLLLLHAVLLVCWLLSALALDRSLPCCGTWLCWSCRNCWWKGSAAM
jgi:hypothetical protein